MIWILSLILLMVGGCMGFASCAMLMMAGEAERREEEFFRKWREE